MTMQMSQEWNSLSALYWVIMNLFLCILIYRYFFVLNFSFAITFKPDMLLFWRNAFAFHLHTALTKDFRHLDFRQWMDGCRSEKFCTHQPELLLISRRQCQRKIFHILIWRHSTKRCNQSIRRRLNKFGILMFNFTDFKIIIFVGFEIEMHLVVS